MSLTSKTVAFRVYDFNAKLEDDALDGFAQNAAPPVDTVRDEALFGWTSPVSPLDNEIVRETCVAGKFFHLNLTVAQKKVPASLLRAYASKEILEATRQNGGSPLSKKDQAIIRENIRKAMLPRMPPSLSVSDVAVDTGSSRLYTDALSAGATERLVNLFHQSARSALRARDPDTAALNLFGVRADELEPVSFTPDKNNDYVIRGIGLDFLTYLLYRFENGTASFDIGRKDPVEVALDGPVSLVLEGQGAHRVTLRDGVPLGSVEIQAALMAGKKISSVKMFLKCGGEDYSAVVDGLTFAFRAVKLPPRDSNRDAKPLFSDAMVDITHFTDLFYGVYGAFLRERADPEAWRKSIAAYHRWLPSRHVDA